MREARWRCHPGRTGWLPRPRSDASGSAARRAPGLEAASGCSSAGLWAPLRSARVHRTVRTVLDSGPHGGRSSAGRAPGCGPGGRGFESPRSPFAEALLGLRRVSASGIGSSPDARTRACVLSTGDRDADRDLRRSAGRRVRARRGLSSRCVPRSMVYEPPQLPHPVPEARPERCSTRSSSRSGSRRRTSRRGAEQSARGAG